MGLGFIKFPFSLLESLALSIKSVLNIKMRMKMMYEAVSDDECLILL